MNYYKVKQPNTVSEIQKNINGGLHTGFHVMIETPVVFVHREKQVDSNVCAEMGYEIYEAYYNGGTIVGNAGDMALAHFSHHDNGWDERFVAYFAEWLKNKGLNVTCDRNDVLVDGYKVCGLCVTRYGRIDYTAGFIGINTNLDDIKAICRKPMQKVPKGLSEYGITSEEVEEMFLDFCRTDGGEVA